MCVDLAASSIVGGSCPGCRARKTRRGFTLIEVLVVVAIIALLMAVLLPTLKRAREHARTTQCTGQLRELMRAALYYAGDHGGRLPGTGITNAQFAGQYDAGTRSDWLSWFGTWTVMIDMSQRGTSKAWANAPRGGRLYKYYRDPDLLRCPSAKLYNGKFSYSTPENVSMAMKDPTGQRNGLPPIMSKVKHPSLAIQFLDEDELNGLSSYSLDDGFGEPDMFADRHLGKAAVAFFDGHVAAYYFPRGPGNRTSPNKPEVRFEENRSKNPFEAWMIQIAPFNSRRTPRPWRWNGQYEDYPRFKRGNNKPGCGRIVGCEN